MTDYDRTSSILFPCSKLILNLLLLSSLHYRLYGSIFVSIMVPCWFHTILYEGDVGFQH